MRKSLPPLSTEGKPDYREWTQDEFREHMERVRVLATEFLESPEITEAMFAEIDAVTGPPQL